MNGKYVYPVYRQDNKTGKTVYVTHYDSFKNYVTGREVRYTPMYPTYVKCFWDDEQFTCNENSKFMVSTYVLHGLDGAIKHAKNILENGTNENLYAVCPLYKNKYTNNFTDCQISITGTSYVDEDKDDTFRREMGEETGLLVSNEMTNRTFHRIIGNKYIQNYWLMIDENTKMVEPTQRKENNDYPKDDHKSKIQAFVFGKYDDIKKIYSGKICPLLSKDTDSSQNEHEYLIGIRLVSVLDIINICDKYFPHLKI